MRPLVGTGTMEVFYSVTQSDGLYDYTYSVFNPPSGPNTVNSFKLGFDATEPSVVPGSVDLGGTETLGTGLAWEKTVNPGTLSATFSFQSPFPPILENEAGKGPITGQWSSSNTGGTMLPVPDVAAPEPETISLIGAALLVLPFRMKRTAGQ
jgi:hypothetical protein